MKQNTTLISFVKVVRPNILRGPPAWGLGEVLTIPLREKKKVQ
jgi:hypothetical protein